MSSITMSSTNDEKTTTAGRRGSFVGSSGIIRRDNNNNRSSPFPSYPTPSPPPPVRFAAATTDPFQEQMDQLIETMKDDTILYDDIFWHSLDIAEAKAARIENCRFFPVPVQSLPTTTMMFSLSDNCGAMNYDDIWKSINESPVGTFCEPIPEPDTIGDPSTTTTTTRRESQGYDTTTTTTTKSGIAVINELKGKTKMDFLEYQITFSGCSHSLRDGDDGTQCAVSGMASAGLKTRGLDSDTTTSNKMGRHISVKEDQQSMFTVQDRVPYDAATAVGSSNVVVTAVAGVEAAASTTTDYFSDLTVRPLPSGHVLKQQAIKGGLRRHKKGDVKAASLFHSKAKDMGFNPRFVVDAEGSRIIHFDCPVKNTEHRVEARLDNYYYYDDKQSRTLLYMEVNPVNPKFHLCPSKSVEEILKHAAEAQNSYTTTRTPAPGQVASPLKEKDYCCGRGGGFAQRKGNVEVLKMRDKCSNRIAQCTNNKQKKAVRQAFDQELEDKEIRFMENFDGKGLEEGEWYEVTKETRKNRIQTLLQPQTMKRRQACLDNGTTVKADDEPKKRAKHSKN